ncbi:hypothetical protein NUU61_008970 [Penicillium alfredii]|uniref:UDP-N-acetylglucosamine transferase subunit ALG14 n=1 Tax=Penicillium alfredii TaxID=1506179 RepID=A0A9W9JWX9_9EURO|nr:uncharacterized protein NUU61_008970 [Penicillium alfredii]KAJ5084391.1 hypothetical protein NUU61_008970 [Penicillium alfredii]
MAFTFPWGLLGVILVSAALLGVSTIAILILALTISHNTAVAKCRPKHTPAHLLVVLGSGGHTTEMLSMLDHMELDQSLYTYRTYLVSSGDSFSANKAVEFENKHKPDAPATAHTNSYSVVTVPRARKVHQSYLSAPFSTLECFWACLLVLRGLHPDQPRLPGKFTSPYPDIIFANGPATAVCVMLAAKLLRFLQCIHRFFSRSQSPRIPRLRTVFVESWARVRNLSLSGLLLLPVADRFFVQWPGLGGRRAWWGMQKTEYVGWLVL